ncbi:MAG: hypothetical protein WCG85_03630 [Polyangia bacterium]
MTGLLGGLLLAGCGSGGKSNVDAPVLPPPPPDAAPPPEAPIQPDAGTTAQPDGDDTDAGCDEDAHTEDWCIKNWPANVGGGTPVNRQQNYQCTP